jgi:hypothetical protein
MPHTATPQTDGERRILAEAHTGNLVDLSHLPDDQRVVSGDLIRRLCVGAEATNVDPRGISLKGAQIVGLLDLSYCTVPHPLRFDASTFDEVPDFTEASLPALWINGSSLPGLVGNGIRIDNDLSLASSRIAGAASLVDEEETSAVWLRGARIGGSVECDGATFGNEDGNALNLRYAVVSGYVSFQNGFKAAGEVRLPGAKIGGDLDCAGATFSSAGKVEPSRV